MNNGRAKRKETRPILKQWGKIQDSLAHITGLTFTTVGRNGKILAAGGENSLCLLLAGSPRGKDLCRGSCLLEADKARRGKGVVHFRCQAGLQCFAVPILVEGSPVAATLGGRILDKAPDFSFFQDLARRVGLSEEEVLQAVGTLKLENVRTLSRVAEMVEQTGEVLFASAYHHNEAQRHLSLLTTLFHLGTDLSPEKDPLEIYALVVNSISILFDVEGAFLALLHEESGHFRIKTAFGSAQQHCLGVKLPLEKGLSGEVSEERAPLVTDDYHRLLRSGFPEQVRSAALFPLLFGESVRGLLVILNTPLDGEAVKLVNAFCSQASTAIQNTILRQELKEKVDEANRLVRVQSLISPLLDRDDLLKAIFEEAARMTTAEQASLMLLNRKTNELVVKLARGEHSPVIQSLSLGAGEGFAGKVARQGLPLLVDDLEKDGRFHRKKRPRYRSNSFLIVPVTVNDRVMAVINLADKAGGYAFTREDLDALNFVIAHASIALERSEFYGMTKELRKMSMTDHLTQLLNRRSFQERSTAEIQRAQRYKLPLSLVMLDLDDFKCYNDTHGHPAGDSLLIGVSNMIRQSVRGIDIVSRMGGEEFAILSPQTETGEALTVAERVREAVHGHSFPHDESQPLGSVSLSAGVATYPSQADSLEELLNNADRALYRAKNAGKNRVLLYA